MNTQEKINAVRKLLDEIETELDVPTQMTGGAQWRVAADWHKAGDAALTFKDIVDACDEVSVGVDGDGTTSPLALTIVGRLRHEKGWATWSHAWAHVSLLRTMSVDQVAVFDFFRAQGCVTIVDLVGADVAELSALVAGIQKQGRLTQVGLDPAACDQLYTALLWAGINPGKLVGVSRGWKMGGAIKTVERALAEGTLKHAKQPLVEWAVRNCRTEQRANSTLITKKDGVVGFVEPLIALFSAIGLLSLAIS